MQRARGRQRRTDPDAEAREALLNGASSASMNGAAGEEKDPQSLLGTVLGVSRDVVTQRRIVSGLSFVGSSQVVCY